MNISSTLSRGAVAVAAALAVSFGAVGVGSATAQPTHQSAPSSATGATRAGVNCAPAGRALSFSDGLDKVSRGGVTVGGLSSLAYDTRRRAWASTVDNRVGDPSRIWFFRDLRHPRLIGEPLILRRPDGTPYDGTTADNEGLAVLPDGRFLVSSESEPSIRIFSRRGIEQESLPIPARFAVTGTTAAGEATANATLEGLTISPDGRTVVAAMEGSLSGDVSSAGDATHHRFLVYQHGRAGWRLAKQLDYRTETGARVPEVAIVGRHDLLVEEAAFTPATGNAVSLYLVRGYDRAADVSRVTNLSTVPGLAVRKQLLADLVSCPTLGATSKQPQANPLLDNYEGMAVTSLRQNRHGAKVGVTLISDDNFSATQITRVLNLRLRIASGR